jgi:hypothetical protein
MDEVEKKVNAMIGESTMNEYKAFKNLVKHKKRINHVFSEVCGDKSFHSRHPGINKKAPVVVVASCSFGPPKISRRTSSNKRKGIVEGTSSATLCLEKTRSLESSKRKHKSTEAISDAELQAAIGLTGLSGKKMKKAVKKVVSAGVRRIPSAFDDDFLAEPIQKGFSSWPFLRFNFHEHCTLGSKNEFVDIDSFSDVATEEAEISVAAVETADPQPVHRQDEASPKFMKELEMTVHKGEDPAPDVPFVETHENLPEDQDPSPSMIAFNKSFGTSYRGELLSVGYEKIDARDGSSKLLTLWNSSKIMGETGEGHSEPRSPPLIGSPEDLPPSSSGSAPPSRVTIEMLTRKGL